MLIRSAVTVTVSSTYERLTSLVGIVVLSRLIEPAEIGSFALGVSIITIVGELLNFGLPFALMSQPTATPAITWAHALLQVGSAGTILLVSATVRPFVLQVLGEPMGTLLVVLAGTRVILALGVTSRVLLEKELRFGAVGAVNIVAGTVSLALGIVLALRGYGIWALVLGAGPPSLVGTSIQTAGYLLLRPLEMRRFTLDIAQLRWYVAYGGTLWLGIQAFAISTQFDNLVVGTFLGPAALGLYDRAYRVVQTSVALVNQTFGRVALAVYARLQAIEPEKGRRSQELSAGLLVRLVLPAAGVLILAPSELTRVLLGPGWEGAGVLLALLAPYSVFRVLDENLLAYLLGTGRNWERTAGWLIVAGISIPALPLFVRVVGTVGAPVAVGLAMAAGMCWQQHRVGPGSLVGLLSDGLRPFLIALAAGGVTLALKEVVHPAGVGGMLTLKTALMLSGYLVLLILFDRARLRQLVGEFRDANYLLRA